MADNNLIFTITYFPDPTSGRPVALGQVFIGIPGLDPEDIGNRVTVNLKEEDGTLVPIPPESQPLQTSAGGVILHNGSPVQVLIDEDYSIKVLDNLGGQIYFLSDVDAAPIIEATDVTYSLTACPLITETNVQDALNELCNAVNTGIEATDVTYSTTGCPVITETNVQGALTELCNALNDFSSFPLGTNMLFNQALAPTGWTIDTSVDDKVVMFSDGSPISAGDWTISGLAVGSHALSDSELSHTHPTFLTTSSGGMNIEGLMTGAIVSGATGHDHPLTADGDWRPAYQEIIAATKD